jgi:hypothetical protein
MSVAFSALVNMNTSVPGLISVRAVFYREQASSMYSSFAYSLSLLLVELPYLAMIVLCSSSVGYFMFGLRSDAGAFFFHYLITFTLGAVYISIGQFVSALVPTFEVAQAGASIYCACARLDVCACRRVSLRAPFGARSRQRCAANTCPLLSQCSAFSAPSSSSSAACGARRRRWPRARAGFARSTPSRASAIGGCGAAPLPSLTPTRVRDPAPDRYAFRAIIPQQFVTLTSTIGVTPIYSFVSTLYVIYDGQDA